MKQTVLILGVALVLGSMIPQADAAGFFRRLFRTQTMTRQYVPHQQNQANNTEVNVIEDTVAETPMGEEEALPSELDTGNFVESESDSLAETETIAPVEEAIGNDQAAAEEVEAAKVAEEETLQVDGLPLTETERHVYDYTNAERKRRGLAPLQLNRKLIESARRQAQWMAQTGVFQHGRSGFAENIAMGQPSPQSVVRAWMNSSGHMRNMMNRSHGCIGIGAVRGRNGQLYWCQQFSR